FEIKGASDAIRQRFSKRRAEVEAAIDKFVVERGRQPNSAEIAQLASETRSAKLKQITTPEVRQLQRSQLSSSELATLETLKRRALAHHSIEPGDSREHSRGQLRIGSN